MWSISLLLSNLDTPHRAIDARLTRGHRRARQEVLDEEVDTYEKRTPKSKALYAACGAGHAVRRHVLLPGG